MSKRKVGRVVFRKIRGRIVPVVIKNINDGAAAASSYAGNKFRKIVAETPDKQRLGTLNLLVPKKGKHAEVLSVNVEKEFRRRGISKQLFERASQFAARAGKKFLRSEDIQAVAQVKIRSSQGWFKAGNKLKSRSRFTADQFGPYGEKTKRIGPKTAIDFIKQNNSPASTGRQIKGTTMIRRKKK